MEIVTAPYRPAPSPWSRLLVGLAVLAPVTLLTLVPIGFGLQRYVVTTHDMAPAVDRGAVVIEREVPVGSLRVGDVITYDPPPSARVTGPVTHRVVEVRPGSVVTRGDARAAADPWRVPVTEPTVSRAVVTLPRIGLVYLALLRPGVRPALAGGVVALSVAAALARRRRRVGPGTP